ncbi:MAG: hypothetical protein J2P22_10065 [Nocardioides sp.]|nr:hypothetical protein [Nocardioides sp.]
MTEEVERFRATNGRVTGYLGLGLCALVAVVLVMSGSVHLAVSGLLGCAFAAVLLWAAMLRPTVSASATELRMRTLFEDVTIPLASIDTVIVRRYLLVRSGGNKYICPAISRSLRKTVRSEMKWGGGQQMLAPGIRVPDRTASLKTDAAGEYDLDYPDFVEQEIGRLAGDDRARRGIEARSEEEYELGGQVERRTAWLVVIALAVLGVAFLVSLFIGG